MGEGAAFGRKVKGVKVFAEDSADYLELLLTRYQQQRGTSDDVVRAFVNALDDEQLARFAAPGGAEARDEHAARRPVLLPVLRRAGPPSRRRRSGWRCRSASGDSS